MSGRNGNTIIPLPEDAEELLPYANAVQAKYIKAYARLGTLRAVAEHFGVRHQSVGGSLRSAVKRAAKRGWAPSNDLTEPVPEGFSAEHSTLYRSVRDDDGNEIRKDVVLQWVKSKLVKEALLELAVEAIKEAFEGPLHRVEKIDTPKVSTDDLLAVYPMGDPHLGMYAWAEEAGDDFDVVIAERELTLAMERLVESAPACRTALIANLGDFFHSDTLDNKTRRSGHTLDVDTRWTKVLRVGVRAMRSCIEHALRKHEKVHVINEIGNHDDQTAQVLTLALEMAYENNPRITFDSGPGRFHYFRFHDVLIGVHHGDGAKPNQLGGIMATDRPLDWGATKFRYWLTGHIHTHNTFELPGCHVESFRTLAPKDAWTASKGYRSGRDMYCLVIHKNYGEIERHRKDILMLK